MTSTRRPAYGQGGDFQRRTRDAGLFWWTILITFLLVMTAGSWIFSLYLFAFPEKPFNYKLLAKLEKLEALEDFTSDTVPDGRFNDARALYRKFYHFSSDQLEGTNGKLKRNYLWNFNEQQPIYVEGSFRISDVRELTADDYFTSGVIVQAYAVEEVEDSVSLTSQGQDKVRRIFPNAVFEFVFPATEIPETLFTEGQEITVNRSRDFAAVLNIKRLGSDHLCFTALPLLYGTYQVSDTESLSMTPPGALNIEAPWPLSKKPIQRNRAVNASGTTPGKSLLKKGDARRGALDPVSKAKVAG
ncbi:MAG: hypothetical protein ACI9R3_001414 [Verrucomicrobiales bacterium]|jgi:hypothetical protein